MHWESPLWWLRFAAQQIGNFTRGFDFSDVACEYIIFSGFYIPFPISMGTCICCTAIRGSWYKIAYVKAYEVHARRMLCTHTPFTHSFVSVVNRFSHSRSSSLLVLSSTTNISLCDRLLSLTHHGVFIVEKGENTSSNTETDVRSELCTFEWRTSTETSSQSAPGGLVTVASRLEEEEEETE